MNKDFDRETMLRMAGNLHWWSIQHWYERNLPWRLIGVNTVRSVLVEALLVQTRADKVAEKFDWIFEDVQWIEQLDDEVLVARMIDRAKSLGLPKLKEMALQSLVMWLKCRTYDLKALWGLPGVGPYMHGMIAALIGEAMMPVDCNVARVAQRANTFLTPEQWIGEILGMAKECRVPHLLEEPLIWVRRWKPEYLIISAVLDVGSMFCAIGSAPQCERCPLMMDCEFALRGVRQMSLI